MAKIRLNQSPAPTYSWLGVNAAETELNALRAAVPELTVPEGITVTESENAGTEFPAVEKELTEYLAAEGTVYYEIAGSAEEPVRLELNTAGNAGFVIRAAADKQLTVIQEIRAEEAAVQTLLEAEPYAKIKLIQVFSGGKAASAVGGTLGDHAELNLVQVFLHTKEVYSGTAVSLDGRGAGFRSHLGYMLDEQDHLDINLNILHNGKKTESETDVKGVLRGAADKIFRGTIDFRQGAAGAKGAEQEDVLLMDKTVRNRTVPVILCAEEDVEGSHGASIGQLDAQHIFYLQSRGIPEDKIYEMMAQSKLGSIIRQIGDAETEQRIARLIGKEEADA